MVLKKAKTKKKEKRSSVGGSLLAKLFCGSKKQQKQQYQEYSSIFRYRNVRNVSSDESIRLLPMSVCPGMSIRENYGLVDVHLIRRVYLPADELIVGPTFNDNLLGDGIGLTS